MCLEAKYGEIALNTPIKDNQQDCYDEIECEESVDISISSNSSNWSSISHPIECRIKQKLIERNAFTAENYSRAIDLAQQRLGCNSFDNIQRDINIESEHEIMIPYHQLPLFVNNDDDEDINYDDIKVESDGNSISFEFGDNDLELQSDHELN